MRVALDTNLLVYAEGLNGADRQREASAILDDYGDHLLVVPVQVLLEFSTVMMRKAGMSADDVVDRVRTWAGRGETIDSDQDLVEAAVELAATHRIAFFDAVVMASAAAAGCSILLSEDLNPGFTWRGVVVRNPFAVESSSPR